MENLTDTRVKKIFDIVSDYTNCLNSIKETFDSNYSILKNADITTKDTLTDFISKFKINTECITPQQSKELKPIIKRLGERNNRPSSFLKVCWFLLYRNMIIWSDNSFSSSTV